MQELLTALPSQPSAAAVHFSGDRGVFRRLVLRGAPLELVTVGFYRFWLATDIRRHLWSHTSVDGDPLEYTGRAKELLIGFLFALAILVPVYLVYFLVGLEAERLQAFASIPLFLLLYLFYHFALYRARRYRVTRTVWRGLRFSMGGSGWGYSWRAALWTLLSVITLGIAFPWRQAALERFKMRHTSYGTLQGAFQGTGGDLFKRVWWLWLLSPSALLIIPLPFIYAAFKAIEWKWWISSIRFGDVAFESRLTRGALIAIYWKVAGWFVLLSVLLSLAYTAIVMGALFLTGSPEPSEAEMLAALQHPAVLAGFGALYLLMAVTLGAIFRIYLARDIWAKIAGTSVVLNLVAADDVTRQGDLADALGEGFADSLDIGGF